MEIRGREAVSKMNLRTIIGPTSSAAGWEAKVNSLDRLFWAAFLSIAIIGAITWLAIFEHNYHPRIYSYSEDVTILQVRDSELDFNHPEGVFTIWWQSGNWNRRLWPP